MFFLIAGGLALLAFTSVTCVAQCQAIRSYEAEIAVLRDDREFLQRQLRDTENARDALLLRPGANWSLAPKRYEA